MSSLEVETIVNHVWCDVMVHREGYGRSDNENGIVLARKRKNLFFCWRYLFGAPPRTPRCLEGHVLSYTTLRHSFKISLNSNGVLNKEIEANKHIPMLMAVFIIIIYKYTLIPCPISCISIQGRNTDGRKELGVITSTPEIRVIPEEWARTRIWSLLTGLR